MFVAFTLFCTGLLCVLLQARIQIKTSSNMQACPLFTHSHVHMHSHTSTHTCAHTPTHTGTLSQSDSGQHKAVLPSVFPSVALRMAGIDKWPIGNRDVQPTPNQKELSASRATSQQNLYCSCVEIKQQAKLSQKILEIWLCFPQTLNINVQLHSQLGFKLQTCIIKPNSTLFTKY